jgi:hypothetical protein
MRLFQKPSPAPDKYYSAAKKRKVPLVTVGLRPGYRSYKKPLTPHPRSLQATTPRAGSGARSARSLCALRAPCATAAPATSTASARARQPVRSARPAARASPPPGWRGCFAALRPFGCVPPSGGHFFSVRRAPPALCQLSEGGLTIGVGERERSASDESPAHHRRASPPTARPSRHRVLWGRFTPRRRLHLFGRAVSALPP